MARRDPGRYRGAAACAPAAALVFPVPKSRRVPRPPRFLATLVWSIVLATQASTALPGQEPPAAGPPAAAETPPAGQDAAEPKPERRGIAVDDPLVHTHCARCHTLDERAHMTRISYVRKSPEGWSETIKRMIRLHGLQLVPEDAKQLVRSLANSHGLARSEAERGLYESERRVHWSEEQHDEDFKRACAQCHPLGRVLLQQRDGEEWQLLRATHVAMFPLARGQMGGGPPPEEPRRPRGEAGAGAEGDGQGRARRGGEGGEQNVGDRVLQRLAKDQPLFTPAWQQWTRNRREVPLAGTWTVLGHETGRGALRGTATLTRVAEDEYSVVWRLGFADGTDLERSGRGILYAGYSWRGRSQDPGADGASWREVLLLDDDWTTLKGRFFTGHYDEVGVDVTLVRDSGRPRVLALDDAAVVVPSTGHRLVVHGEALPAALSPADFFVGAGLRATAVERLSDRRAVLVVDAAPGTELGRRTVAFAGEPGSAELQLYDTVDYVRIRPLQGLARIGGLKHPRQLERYEAFAVHRGADGKPYTDDDQDLFLVRPRWGLAEFRVRDGDDDVGHVGTIDPATGVFTPNVDGPNPARKWQANNVGDVFVTAAVELEVGVRPPAPAGGRPGDEPKPPTEPLPRERRTFFARSHLLVTVPLYVRWQALDWEDR